MRVQATSNAPDLLVSRVQTVCTTMEQGISAGKSPSDVAHWESVLPRWFLAAHAEPNTRIRPDASLEEKRQYSRSAPWTLPGWLGWWSAELKNWTLTAAEVDGTASASFELLVEDINGPIGSFEWLVRSAGGHVVDEEGT
jgi:hypothetical protein